MIKLLQNIKVDCFRNNILCLICKNLLFYHANFNSYHKEIVFTLKIEQGLWWEDMFFHGLMFYTCIILRSINLYSKKKKNKTTLFIPNTSKHGWIDDICINCLISKYMIQIYIDLLCIDHTQFKNHSRWSGISPNH